MKSINWTLKSDLRQACFHAIETMFELIFAFEPNNENLNEDIKVLQGYLSLIGEKIMIELKK